jgi:hypothetical protein
MVYSPFTPFFCLDGGGSRFFLKVSTYPLNQIAALARRQQ